MRVWQRLTGYVLLLAGVLIAAVGLIALRSRGEESTNVPWGWPEAIVLITAVLVVIVGLWILGTRRFERRW